MSKYRMKFAKTGRAVYISHLDLMHTMQRAFSRAGLQLEYSKGFNPHPQISMAMPLSVGISSQCELMDFSLISDLSNDDIIGLLNPVLPEGIEVLSVYSPEIKLSGIKWLEVAGKLVYDREQTGVAETLNHLFEADSLPVNKKTKRGSSEINVIPAIEKIYFAQNDNNVTISAIISASEPVLNPMTIVDVIDRYAPEAAPDYVLFTRIAVFNEKMEKFE